MEDRAVAEAIPGGSVLVGVFDGHVGAAVAAAAAARLLPLYAEVAAGSEEPGTPALREVMRRMQSEVAAEEEGSTAVIALVGAGMVRIASAGDSRAVLVGESSARTITRDHRITDRGELDRVRAAGAIIQPPYFCLPDGSGLMTTRGLGDLPFESVGLSHQPDVFELPIGDWSHLVVATDGVWDALDASALPALLARSEDAPAAAGMIVGAAARAGSTDNITAVTVALPGLRGTGQARAG